MLTHFLILISTGLAPVPQEPVTPPAANPASAPGDAERSKLEEEFRKMLAANEPSASPGLAPIAASQGGRLQLIDIAFDLLGAVTASTAPDARLRALEAGGHDPFRRGFTIQNAELTFAGVVDPFLRGDANIVMQIDSEGGTTTELEEAYVTTLDLPENLQLKAGQFFTAFGRLNPQHPHSWEFADQPIVNSRFLGGDGLRNPGVQLSWLTPLPFFAEFVTSVQQASGETAASFLGVAGDDVAGRPLADPGTRSAGDMLWLARLRTSFDPTDELTLVPGLSAAFGPNGTAADADTAIYGVDFYAKWKPLANDHGWPFVAWQTEAMRRVYQAAAVFDGAALADPAQDLGDWGAYSQILWGFRRSWVAGMRYDVARGEADSYSVAGVPYDSASDPFRDARKRVTLDLTYFPSEFSKLRLQYDYDRAEFLDEASHTVILQFEILFGAHGAHKF